MEKKQEVAGRKPLISEAEIGTRIAECADKVGGKKRLAELSGIKETQLYRYIGGHNSPTAGPLIRIARSASVTLDWLMTGESQTLDVDLLEVVIEAVEEAVASSGKELTPSKRAKICSLIYEQYCDDGPEAVDPARVLRLITVAA